ncbi:hypothetical protein RJT34_04061 [Clitoria ternatea]|uniref:Uncharacterized protein n=1 Tax=Clitoria ternatea TaxID=43366 RepID=A0AAN9KNC7_CLITE
MNEREAVHKQKNLSTRVAVIVTYERWNDARPDSRKMHKGRQEGNVRPLHNQEPVVSFAVKQKEKDNINNNAGFSVEDKDSKGPALERCPDLNLDLTISPPHQPLQNTENCSCGIRGDGNAPATTNTGYDFLGLDYRSLEMNFTHF